MFITPMTLIERTIDDLESLRELLADEVDARLRSEPRPEGRLCKETLLTISVLLPKLQAVRCSPVAMTPEHRGVCASCDDG